MNTKSFKINSPVFIRRLAFLLFCFSTTFLQAQSIRLECNKEPLNQVLIEMRGKHQLKFSFDDVRLSQYQITASRQFDSPEAALDFLLKDLPLAYEKSSGIYVIFPKVIPPVLKNYLLGGRFADRDSKESLPYTHLLINGNGMVTDQRGNFSFLSSSDSLFHLQASYLGYYLLDTIVGTQILNPFYLIPSTFNLNEIRIEGLKVVRSLQVGNLPGVLRLNHKVAGYLPGNGDNSVFNLLRLQPGILAAGEQSNDLIVWGSYEGQSQVLFDGFSLFGMKNFNDNISAVNPFMAKDIQVMKGGFNAEYGERVGGLINITGVDGDVDDAHMKLSVNNMTLNGFFSSPVTKQSNLMLAVRQTYYELYETGQISLGSRGRGGNGSFVDRNIYPDYNFRDFNLKYSGKTNLGDSYSLSFMQGKDRFSYSLEYETQQSSLAYEDRENNQQLGFSGIYNKGWKNGGRSELTMAYSELETDVTNIRQSGRWQSSGGHGAGSGGSGGDNVWEVNKDDFNQNKISEAKINLQNHLAVSPRHKLGFGIGLFYNEVFFSEDSFQVNLVEQQIDASRMNVFLEDHFNLAHNLQITGGVRADYSMNLNEWYVQPRLSGTFKLSDFVKINAAWGLYRQYITRSSIVDELGNYRYLWAVCDNESIPVLQSRHAVLGFTYHQNDFTFSVEAYDKQTDGLTRYRQSLNERDLFEGDSKSKGIDFVVKKDYKGHSAWLSYSLSETLEHFDYFLTDRYRRALHDQRHELKAAALIHLNPFYFSANFVYGSGFPDPLLLNDENDERDYQRLDVAAVYRFAFRKFALEAGVSILNVLNYENIKYANFIRVPDDQDATVNLHAEAVPFTPTMFLNFSF